MLTGEHTAVDAVASESGAAVGGGLSPITSAADLAPAAAWSRRVRWIGGLIQAAFAGFWLVRQLDLLPDTFSTGECAQRPRTSAGCIRSSRLARAMGGAK
jgi:hypothetical protein